MNIGHNGHVAWTHTVNTSAHFTLYYLALDPADPTRYVIDGVSKPLAKRTLAVDAGAAGTITRDVWFSEFGPMLVLPGLLDWTPAAGFALADANAQNDRLLEAWWQLNKARTLDQFKRSVERTLGIPWVHSVAVDREGRAYYGDITVVPKVTAQKQQLCVLPPFRPLVPDGLFILAGTTSACRWGSSPGTPQPGIFAARELPSLVRTDWVQNSNDSAWLTNPAAPLTGFPDIVSRDSYPQGGRTRIGLAQIEARLAGTDGLPGNRFTGPQLGDIAFSNRSFFATALLADLRALCAAGTTAPDGSSIAAECGVLATWDGKAELTSIGWPLFDAWREALRATGIDFWSVPFDPAQGATTPTGLAWAAKPAVADAARQALADASRALGAAGVSWTKPWGEVQVAIRGARAIPMHGGSGSDVYNAIDSRPAGASNPGLFDVFYGSSTVAVIDFATSPPSYRGWLTYSQSTDPASPHFGDQTERFSRKAWITFPYTPQQIAADPNLRRRLIAE